MIAPSTVSPEAHRYIRGQLDALAAREGVRILFAIESGSRAWGFPSADSDYDVRFVYARSADRYRSVRDVRDVIETPTLDDPVLGVPLDLNGWDVRKALQLALRSNPVLREWLVSPVRYGEVAGAALEMLDLVDRVTDRASYAYHYDRLARGAWDRLAEAGDRVKVKRYCYALRPVLMLRWLSSRRGLPPMDAASLAGGLDLGEEVLASMARLFDLKRGADEQDFLPRQPVLDALIAETLAVKAARPPQVEADTLDWPAADAAFHRLIGAD